MVTDAAPMDREALERALEAARVDLLAAYYAKQDADRRYLETFVAYDRMASTLRRALNADPREPNPS